MSHFISNAEMSLRLLKMACSDGGKPLTQEQEDHFMKSYTPVLNKIDNDFDDSLGLPRLTEKEDTNAAHS